MALQENEAEVWYHRYTKTAAKGCHRSQASTVASYTNLLKPGRIYKKTQRVREGRAGCVNRAYCQMSWIIFILLFILSDFSVITMFQSYQKKYKVTLSFKNNNPEVNSWPTEVSSITKWSL